MATQRTAQRQNLVQASREWSTRPADQRFWTLKDLYERAQKYAKESYTLKAPLSLCEVVPVGEDLQLSIPDIQSTGEEVATFQHYSFGQLCSLTGLPAKNLREWPSNLAAEVMNWGLQHRTAGDQVLMLHKNGDHVLRCVTSDEYSRIWNYQVAEMALALEETGDWMTPPARPCGLPGIPTRVATTADVLKNSAHKQLGVGVGDLICPSGLYQSDHDCFIFQVSDNHPIDAGGGEMLYRGVIWSNSEVGDARFKGTMFLYDTICGNHIIWGATIIAEISIPHRGKAQEMFRQAMAAATNAMMAPASEDEQRIERAKAKVLGPGSTEVVDFIFKKGWGLAKRECEDAYVLATRHAEEHGTEPNTAWGYAAGLTRMSQGQYADRRDQIDRAAGKVLGLAL